VTDNDRVIVAGSDPGTETTAIILFKILFGRDQDLGRRIQAQEFRGPLLSQVIGYHEHGFAAQAKALALHGGSNHFIGLARANHMSQQRVAAIERMCNRIPLMLSEHNLRVHAGEGNVLSVIFAGADAVEQLIVLGNERFPTIRILPDPVPEGIFNSLLLLLRQCGCLLIQHTLFLTLGILDGIVDADITEIQRILQNPQAAGSVRTVSQIVGYVVVREDIFPVDPPF